MGYRFDYEQMNARLEKDVEKAWQQVENAKKGVLRAQLAQARFAAQRTNLEDQIAIIEDINGKDHIKVVAVKKLAKIFGNRKPMKNQPVERSLEDAREAELKERLGL